MDRAPTWGPGSATSAPRRSRPRGCGASRPAWDRGMERASTWAPGSATSAPRRSRPRGCGASRPGWDRGMDRAPHVGAWLGNERAATVTPTWVWCISSRVGPSDGSRAPRGRRTRQRARRDGHAHVGVVHLVPGGTVGWIARPTWGPGSATSAPRRSRPRGCGASRPGWDHRMDRAPHVGAGLGIGRPRRSWPRGSGAVHLVPRGTVEPWPLRARQDRTSAEQIYPRPRPRSSENPPGPDTANTRKMTA